MIEGGHNVAILTCCDKESVRETESKPLDAPKTRAKARLLLIAEEAADAHK